MKVSLKHWDKVAAILTTRSQLLYTSENSTDVSGTAFAACFCHSLFYSRSSVAALFGVRSYYFGTFALHFPQTCCVFCCVRSMYGFCCTFFFLSLVCCISWSLLQWQHLHSTYRYFLRKTELFGKFSWSPSVPEPGRAFSLAFCIVTMAVLLKGLETVAPVPTPTTSFHMFLAKARLLSDRGLVKILTLHFIFPFHLCSARGFCCSVFFELYVYLNSRKVQEFYFASSSLLRFPQPDWALEHQNRSLARLDSVKQ